MSMSTTALSSSNGPLSESTIHIKKVVKLNEVEDVSDSVIKAIDYLISTSGKGSEQVLLNISISIINVSNDSNKSHSDSSNNVKVTQETASVEKVRSRVSTEAHTSKEEFSSNKVKTKSIVPISPLRPVFEEKKKKVKDSVETETHRLKHKSNEPVGNEKSVVQELPTSNYIIQRKGSNFVNINVVNALEQALFKRIKQRKEALVWVPEKLKELQVPPKTYVTFKQIRRNRNSNRSERLEKKQAKELAIDATRKHSRRNRQLKKRKSTKSESNYKSKKFKSDPYK